MKRPPQITFKGLEHFNIVEEWVLGEIAKLETFYDRIVGCRVTIAVPHRHHRKGNAYHVCVDLTVAGEEIVVKRAPSLAHRVPRSAATAVTKGLQVGTPTKDLRIAIGEAFKAAGRRLQDYVRRRRGDVETLAPTAERPVPEVVA